MIRGRGDMSCQTEIQRPWQHHQFNPAPAHVRPLGWCPPASCRTSHWGLGVKVDLIHAWHWTAHWVAHCQMTFRTHLSTGIKMFRNFNFAAAPPIVSGRADRGGKRRCLFARTVTSASDDTIQVALSDVASFVNSCEVFYEWVATLEIWRRPQPAWSWRAVTRNKGSGWGGRTTCGV